MSEQNVNQPVTQEPAPNLSATPDNDPYSPAFEQQVAGVMAKIESAKTAAAPKTAPAKPEAKATVELQPTAQDQPAPVEQPKQPLTATKVEMPRHLIERARGMGWSDAKIESYDALNLERTLNDIDATMATAMRRQQQPGPEQPQKKEEPAPAEKLEWLLKEYKREDYDEPIAKALDHIAAQANKLTEPLVAKIAALEKVLKEHNDYLEDHAAQSRAAFIDQIGDKLAAAGYEDVFGRGRSAPGSAAYENKGQLANFLRVSMQNFAAAGIQVDLDQQAAFFAQQKWGQRSPQQHVQQQSIQHVVDPMQLPRGQRPGPREQPTPTNRPTQRQGDLPKGRDAAIAALSNGRLNGWSGNVDLGDIHDS